MGSKLTNTGNLGLRDDRERSRTSQQDYAQLEGSSRLHRDLVAYVVNHPQLGRFIQHPLVSPFLSLDSPTLDTTTLINTTYQIRRAQCSSALEAGDYKKYVFLHEDYYCVDALLELGIKLRLPGSAWWPLVGNTWTASMNIWLSASSYNSFRAKWLRVWGDKRPHRGLSMNQQERETLSAMPDTIQVWRGTAFADGHRGISWTTDRNKAIWFASEYGMTRHGGNHPRLLSGNVRKRHVIAYLSERDESEVVVFPQHVFGITVEILHMVIPP